MAVLTREERRAGARWLAWRPGQKRSSQIGHVVLHLVLIAVGLTFLAPFAWLLSTSLKQSGTEFAYPPQWIPHPIVWSNYKTALVDVVPFFWNDLFNPLIFLNSESNYTMALGLTQYAVGHNGTLYNLQMAAATVMTIPVILLFFFAQRYFMRGFVTTGLAAR